MTTLTSPHDLLAAIPFLVGYKPEDSIILISLHEDSIHMAIRVDFPSQISEPDIALLMKHLQRDNAEQVIAVFYLPPKVSESHSVIQQITKAISQLPLTLIESIIVKENRWLSLICNDLECCPALGNPMPDIESSRVAVEQIAQGKPLPFRNAAELVDSISSLPVDENLIELISSIPKIDYETNPLPQQREGAEAVIDFISDFTAEGLSRDKRLIALVLIRLQDLQVRDFALGSVTSETLETYFNAWRWLLRVAPAGYAAPVANLLAAVAYEKGDGALAHRALDRAEQDNSEYAMTKLLREVFSSGWSPSSFAVMRSELHPRICDAIFSGNINS